MSYINKTTEGLINTILTDAGRRRLSQGNFNISYFQIGDSEVCYNFNGENTLNSFNILRPEYNAQNLTPVPEYNKMNIKYPIFVDPNSGSTYGIPFDASFVDNIFNSAAPRGFFTGSTLYITSAYTINPNFIISNNNLISGNTLIISANSINASVSGTVTPGMFVTLFSTNSITPLSGNSPIFTYKIIDITGDTSTATTVTVLFDRQVPDFNSMGYSGNTSVIFYPSGMTGLYDSVTPEPYWATNVFNFETNCDVSQTDVKVWNMNSPWSESPAGLFSNVNQGYLNFESSGYVGTKEYLGYNTDDGQKDTSSTFYYNSLGEKVTLKPSEQKAIAIVHYTNQSIDNFYGEKFAQQHFDVVN